MNEEWNGDENPRNLYRQIAGSLNYAAQLWPELMFSVSQLSRVMSCPATQENLSLARQVIKYIIGSLDLKITYHPDDPNDQLSEINNELMMFTDSDWATSVDTRCSHGCYQSCLLRIEASRTNQLCYPQRRQIIMKHLKDVASWHTSAASCRTFMTPSAHPPRHTSTIRPALRWPKCLCFPKNRSIFQICASVAPTRWLSCAPLARGLKSQTLEPRPFQSPPL